MPLLATLIATALGGIALLHLFWASGGTWGSRQVVPAIEGRPLFVPGRLATLAVALALSTFATVALLLGDPQRLPALQPLAPYAGLLIGAILLLRAIGEFRYVGFFKRVRGSAFARYDSWLYSPFCLLAGLGFIALAASRL